MTETPYIQQSLFFIPHGITDLENKSFIIPQHYICTDLAQSQPCLKTAFMSAQSLVRCTRPGCTSKEILFEQKQLIHHEQHEEHKLRGFLTYGRKSFSLQNK